jgi:sterol desaturase/sphingolipid hydroxylase (fatty acid hydroxylase superfamily)
MYIGSSWRLTRADYYLDFFIVPLILLFALTAAAEISEHTICAFAGGFLFWTLAEYLIHRFVLHSRAPLKGYHLEHHREPEGYIGVSSWRTPSILAVLWAAACLIFGRPVGSAAFAGFIAAYFAYIVLHDAYHHHARSGAYRRYMGRLHDIHHTRHRVNYGVSSPLWDFFFRTYQATS